MWYGPPGNVPIPLKTSLYSFNMYSFVMGSLCTLPFSLMEPSFHLILGITGSSVCLDCLEHRCSCLVICVIKWSCVLILGTVLRLFFCVYVLDFSLVILNTLSAHVCKMSNFVACVALHSQGSTLLSGVVCSSPTISTYLCCTVPVVLPGSEPVALVGSPTPVGATSAPVACPTSIVVKLVLV